MFDRRQTLHSSERFYRALLLLYPRRFRHRFVGEMAQLFRDYLVDVKPRLRKGGIHRHTSELTRLLRYSTKHTRDFRDNQQPR